MSSPTIGPPARSPDRERLILDHMGFVHALARRYGDRGEPLDDLVQAGMVGLVNAADRFDPARGSDFRSFAAPTVLGEIRRHFRDRTWAVRVPRSVKDDVSRTSKAIEKLQGSLGRSPSVREIADEAGMSPDRVLDALAAHGAYRPLSLARPAEGEGPEGEREVATAEAGFDEVDARMVLARGLARLPPRERVILHLRFNEGLFQSEIAARVGLSQMHVSRLIARALETLRGETDGVSPE
ncbi:MAG TPA: SigB/SigF/SigG family RNA polymerase sigma factor [Miltoncostaeaceae bacterium]|nr:SigB/SigF/SigG family RNA polymerase sigma factor [Miltoncostaeaceae bacterium]